MMGKPRCEKCGKRDSNVRPAEDVVKQDGKPMRICDSCWFETRPQDNR